MATVNLGRVGFVNKGTYSGSTSYKVNDVVDYNSGVYVCTQAHSGQAPTNTSYWKVWVANDKALDSTVVHKTGDETIAGIKTFTSSPIVPTPTTGTQAVNKDYADLKVALASFIGTNQNLATSGYQKLPGGLILQWGVIPVNTGDAINVTLPITFPTAILQAVAVPFGSLDSLQSVSCYWDKSVSNNSSIRIPRRYMNNGGAVGIAVQGASYVAIGY